MEMERDVSSAMADTGTYFFNHHRGYSSTPLNQNSLLALRGDEE